MTCQGSIHCSGAHCKVFVGSTIGNFSVVKAVLWPARFGFHSVTTDNTEPTLFCSHKCVHVYYRIIKAVQFRVPLQDLKKCSCLRNFSLLNSLALLH